VFSVLPIIKLALFRIQLGHEDYTAEASVPINKYLCDETDMTDKIKSPPLCVYCI